MAHSSYQATGGELMPPVVLIVAGLAAVGVGGAIAAVSTTLALTSFWVSTLIFTGISTTIAGVQAEIQKRSLNRMMAEVAGRQITARQPAAPRRIIYGTLVRIGGIITYIDARGTDNEFLDLVITLTGRQIGSIGTMAFNGETVLVDGNGDALGKYAGFVHIEKNLGTDTQAAFPGLVADSGGLWTSAHQQKGCAGVYVRLKYDADAFPAGVPNITFDCSGSLVYDPRSMTTVVSHNAALCTADYLTDSDFGFGVDYATRIDEPELIAAANNCDEQVNLLAGGAEDRYSVNGTFTTDQDPFAMLNILRQSMAGYVSDIGGKWKVMAGVWRAPVVTVDLVDIRGAIALTTNQARRDSHNSVKGTYTNAGHNWQPTDFPVLSVPAYVTLDGGRKTYLDMNLPMTTSSPTAQRIAKIELGRSRLGRVIKLPCKMTAYQFQPGDTATLNLAPLGLTATIAEVLQVKLSIERLGNAPIVGVDLILRATASTVFDWDETTDEAADPDPPTTNLPDPSTVPTPTGLAVAWNDVDNADLISSVMATLTWAAIPDIFVTEGGVIEIQYKESASGTWVGIEPVTGASIQADIGGRFSDSIDYDFRIRARNIHGATGNYQTITNQTAIGSTSTRDAIDIIEDATRSFISTPYVDASRQPVRVRLHDNSADLIDGASLIKMAEYHDSAARLLNTTIRSDTTANSAWTTLSVPYSPILGSAGDYSATMRVKLNTAPTSLFAFSDGTAAADDLAIGSEPWSSVNDALTSNDVYASAGLFEEDTSVTSHYLRITDFTGWTIPTDDTITRIHVKVEAKKAEAVTGVVDTPFAELYVGGAWAGGQKNPSAGALSSSDSILDFDFDGAGWGGTWPTPTQANATDFGVGIFVGLTTDLTAGSTAIMFTDHVEMEIDTNSGTYVLKGRIDVDGAKSNEITLTGPALSQPGTVTVAGLAKGARVVTLEGQVTSQNGSGGRVKIELDQFEYEDQGQEHF